MTTIVFASCMSAPRDPKQDVWRDAATHKPQWLVLAGDNIYMDYWPNLEEPRKWPVADFAAFMYQQYSSQFAVPSFRKLVSAIPAGQVIGVWDDHDFAWNDCYGTELVDGMPEKRLVAHALFQHYFAALNLRPLPAVLPAMALSNVLTLPTATRPIYRALDMAPLRVLLCDVRSYREDRRLDRASASLLGDEQEKWLLAEIAAATSPLLIVSGSVLVAAGDQSWDFFRNFYEQRFLPAVRQRRVLFIGGDIHRNRLLPVPPGHPVEVVSSAAALGFPYTGLRNFGVLEVSGSEASIFLYRRGEIQYSGRFAFDSGIFKTSVSALAAQAVPRSTVKRAEAQKVAALRGLAAK